MTLTEQAIATIAAGCEGVTEGPYNVRRSKHPVDLEYDYSINSEDAPVFAECFGRDARGGYPPTATNAAHIARLDPATVLALCALAQEALQSRREGQQIREAVPEGIVQFDRAKGNDLAAAFGILAAASFDLGLEHPSRMKMIDRAIGVVAAAIPGFWPPSTIRALSHPKPESVKS